MPRSTLYIKQILDWADAHKERTGKWPERSNGRVFDTLDERWTNIDQSLRKGLRGLRPGGSLARLLAERRGKRNRKQLPKYTLRQILRWADAFHKRTGKWPISKSGPIPDAPGETWLAVDIALRKGQRGLPGGNSLAQLLAARRAVQNRLKIPRLSNRQVLAWADSFHRRTGNWPTADSGRVSASITTSWAAVDVALKQGHRGLPGGSSLAKLLARHRGIGRHRRHPPLTIKAILAWADAYRARHGRWPNEKSGQIREARDETWSRISAALRSGRRGLPRGMTLARLRDRYRKRRRS